MKKQLYQIYKEISKLTGTELIEAISKLSQDELRWVVTMTQLNQLKKINRITKILSTETEDPASFKNILRNFSSIDYFIVNEPKLSNMIDNKIALYDDINLKKRILKNLEKDIKHTFLQIANLGAEA